MIKDKIIPIGLLLVALFFAAYKLTESPPTWYDEGMIMQPAINLASEGRFGIQVAPNEFISPQFISVGYPVYFPVSLMFKYFGVNLLSARVVMVIYLLLLVGIFFLLGKRMFGWRGASYGTLLLVSFAPLYGQGKNVLGEVPGLFFLFSFLFFVNKIERTGNKKLYYILAGIFAGLCTITKPLFLVLLPAVAVSALLGRKKIVWQWPMIAAGILGFMASFAVWLATQFQSINVFSNILGFYANPYQNQVHNLFGIVGSNFLRFFTETSPAYFFALFLVWIAAIIIKIKKKEQILLVEIIALAFSFLVVAAYLRTVGWYRYFFPAEIVMLLFFPSSLAVLFNFARERFLAKSLPALILFLLIAFNFYLLGFKSWVADYYASHQTQILTDYFKNFSRNKSIFLYNIPEIAIFLPHHNYYQYMELTHDFFVVGSDQIAKIKAGIPDIIIMQSQAQKDVAALLTFYQVKDTIGRYVVLEKLSE